MYSHRNWCVSVMLNRGHHEVQQNLHFHEAGCHSKEKMKDAKSERPQFVSNDKSLRPEKCFVHDLVCNNLHPQHSKGESHNTVKVKATTQ